MARFSNVTPNLFHTAGGFGRPQCPPKQPPPGGSVLYNSILAAVATGPHSRSHWELVPPKWTCSEHGPRRACTAHMEDTPGASGRTVPLSITENLLNKATLSRLGDVTDTSDCCCSVTKSCPALCYPMNCSTPDFPVLYCLQKFAQTHVH